MALIQRARDGSGGDITGLSKPTQSIPLQNTLPLEPPPTLGVKDGPEGRHWVPSA